MEPTSASSYASNLWTSSSNTSSTPSTSSSKSKRWAQCSRQAKAKSGGTRSDGTLTLGLGAAMSPCLATLASTCCAAQPLLQPKGAKQWVPRTCSSVPAFQPQPGMRHDVPLARWYAKPRHATRQRSRIVNLWWAYCRLRHPRHPAAPLQRRFLLLARPHGPMLLASCGRHRWFHWPVLLASKLVIMGRFSGIWGPIHVHIGYVLGA